MAWIVGIRLSTNAFPQVEAGIEFFSQILLFVCVQSNCDTCDWLWNMDLRHGLNLFKLQCMSNLHKLKDHWQSLSTLSELQSATFARKMHMFKCTVFRGKIAILRLFKMKIPINQYPIIDNPRNARTPSPTAIQSISFIFMQFSAKILSSKRLVYPSKVGGTPVWEILDLPLPILGEKINISTYFMEAKHFVYCLWDHSYWQPHLRRPKVEFKDSLGHLKLQFRLQFHGNMVIHR